MMVAKTCEQVMGMQGKWHGLEFFKAWYNFQILSSFAQGCLESIPKAVSCKVIYSFPHLCSSRTKRRKGGRGRKGFLLLDSRPGEWTSPHPTSPRWFNSLSASPGLPRKTVDKRVDKYHAPRRSPRRQGWSKLSLFAVVLKAPFP